VYARLLKILFRRLRLQLDLWVLQFFDKDHAYKG